jgi:ATP-dependent helicase/nuclease subunit A
MVGDWGRERFGRYDVSRLLAIPESLRQRQAQASNPRTSAWVSANAGSGKTHVLTQRVLRLLLDGTPPAQILCLAYTKAAAANMADRVFSRLAQWTSLHDKALAQAIVECGAGSPDPTKLIFARQLFARTIETPGGLKIQTLHAFAERLLRLFPFEANVPAHFKVLDEREAKRSLIEARDAAFAELAASSEYAGALDLVARESGAAKFDELMTEALSRAEVFGAHDDAFAYAAALRSPLGLGPGVTSASVEAEMLGGDIGRMRRERWAQALDLGKKHDQNIAANLRAADQDEACQVRIQALLDAFFKDGGEGEPRGGEDGTVTTKDLARTAPALENDLRREQDRLNVLRERRRAALTLERSAALFVVARAILASFSRMKAERGALDFNDQIARALALVTVSSPAWVLHKLDYGLDHLLLDEAQDASQPQWGILAALSAEFFAGAGARPKNRTIFAVGDEKQSIFGFQGAAPQMFAEMKSEFAKRHRDSERPFADVPLTFSFRSSQTILDAVDMTFRTELAWRSVAAAGEPSPSHQAIRSYLKGVVELWPPIAPRPGFDPEDWSMPLDPPSQDDPPVVLAKRIAEVIKSWLRPTSPERVVDPDSGAIRRIRESDVMILVRSRNAFFEAMIRALKAGDVKAAGADRLKLKDHIAVIDLIAVGHAAVLPEDDLTLASVLKSPLIGFDDEALMKIAARRSGSLVEALRRGDEAAARDAARRLDSWRARAKVLTPFAFYATLLGQDGGRRALISRLGPEAADPIDEFLTLALAHEQSEAPSLHNFLAQVELADVEIKRDMEVETEGVRVLTVHASKGLEAPIVFLPDSCGGPDSRHEPKLMVLPSPRPGDPPVLAWARKSAEDAEAVADARARAREAQAGEHRRLLYVAMTRAAQRLIVAGYETSKRRPPDCWWDLIHGGLAEKLGDAPAPFREGGKILRYGEGLHAEGVGEAAAAHVRDSVPDWLLAAATPEAAATPLNPSRAGGGGRGDPERALEGRLAHTLLEMLPGLPPERRPGAAAGYLEAWGGALTESVRVALASQVLRAIDAPELSFLFGPNSRGEVPLTGRLAQPGRPDLPYSGRLDRLVATAEGVLIVDFKLGEKPNRPASSHVTQLALYRAILRPLYREATIQAALVYLDGPILAPVSEAELDAALDAIAATS